MNEWIIEKWKRAVQIVGSIDLTGKRSNEWLNLILIWKNVFWWSILMRLGTIQYYYEKNNSQSLLPEFSGPWRTLSDRFSFFRFNDGFGEHTFFAFGIICGWRFWVFTSEQFSRLTKFSEVLQSRFLQNWWVFSREVQLGLANSAIFRYITCILSL